MKTLTEATKAIQQVNIIRTILKDDGLFPNNQLLPMLVYKGALQTTDGHLIKDLFETNRWIGAWEDGIFDYHHYHSSTHEVLGVIKGSARIEMGGPHGTTVTAEPGDVIIIPAGVAHKFVEGDDDFTVVGAYPEGQSYDIKYGHEGERPETDNNIKATPLPTEDPLYGNDGPLLKNWTQ
jgi:uncharacterized protein YjlB